MDLAVFNNLDGRRLEVGVEVSPCGRERSLQSTRPWSHRFVPRSANDGAALEEVRRRKERTNPELSGYGRRARLMVLAAEVGGRCSVETALQLIVCQHKPPSSSCDLTTPL